MRYESQACLVQAGLQRAAIPPDLNALGKQRLQICKAASLRRGILPNAYLAITLAPGDQTAIIANRHAEEFNLFLFLHHRDCALVFDREISARSFMDHTRMPPSSIKFDRLISFLFVGAQAAPEQTRLESAFAKHWTACSLIKPPGASSAETLLGGL